VERVGENPRGFALKQSGGLFQDVRSTGAKPREIRTRRISSNPTLFASDTTARRYRSKEALFRALVSEVGHRISVSATIRYSSRLSLRAQILRFVREAVSLVAEPQTLRLVRAVLAEHIRHPERVEPILRGYWRNEYGFTSWAKAACDDGRLHGDPTKIGHAMSSMMRAQVFWPALLGRLDAQSPAFEAEIGKAVEMFLSYYGHPR